MSESEWPSRIHSKLNLEYKEILRLSEMLARAQIPHVLEHIWDGWRLAYLVGEDVVCSVIEHRMSYGQEADRLEIMGLLTAEEEQTYGDVLGWLTAEDVFERIKAHHGGR